MKTILLTMAVWIIASATCYGQAKAVQAARPLQADADDISRMRFDNLMGQELSQAQGNPSAFLFNRLLAEAERRKVEANVKEYLRVSYSAWLRKIRSYYELSRDPSKTVRIRNMFLSELKGLLQSRYFAKLSDEEASFGQLLVDGEVLQVIDKSDLLANVKPIGGGEEKLIWITGPNTAGFVDGAELSLGFFALRLWALDGDGTRSYTNSVGIKRTVMCIRPHELDLKKVTSQIDLFKFGLYWTQMSKKIDEATLFRTETEFRTWTMGKDTFLARFVNLKNNRVRLERKDNPEAIEVPISRLSEEDKTWIRLELKPFRNWADSTGKFSVVAKFIEFKYSRVHLKRRDDGKKIELSMSRLSKEDQKWIRDELRRRLEEKRQEKKQKAATKK